MKKATSVGKRRRILIVDNMAVESSRRGVYRALAEREEFDVHLLAPESWRESANPVPCEPEETALLHLHTSTLLFGYRHHRILYREMSRLIRSLQPELLYIDTEPENYEAVQALVARRLFAPTAKLALFSSRNIDHLEVGFPYKFQWTHRFCDFLVRRNPVDVLFVRTQSAIPLLEGYAREIVHMPFPIDCTKFHPADARPQAGPPGEITLGFVGRLSERKGIGLLLEALGKLPKNVRLIVAGTGPLETTMLSLADRLGIRGRCEFLPPFPHARIPELLGRIDILVVPSLSTKFWKEQCPRIPIEAMSCGIPVVGSDSGGIPEVVGEAGLIFPEGSVAGLVSCIAELLSDPSTVRLLARKGRERALRVFDVPVIAGATASALLRALARPSPD